VGDGTTTDRLTPTSIGLTNVTTITAGQASAYAVDSSGNVWSWREGDHGELGSGTTLDSSTPTRTGGVSNVTQISAAQHTVFAVTRT
jgi:alpha-tubulin suppressor-like RCC1 family protein